MARKGHGAGTQDTYTKILKRGGADRGQVDPAELARWAVQRAQGAPKGTVLPLRSAIKHYLVSVVGMSDEDANEILPAAKGRSGHARHSLGRAQLDTFYRAVEGYDPSPTRTILLILPRTGLRISEACGLRPADVTSNRGLRCLRVDGKGGKTRLVHLSGPACSILDTWIGREHRKPGSDHWLFPGNGGGAIQPQSVRFACRQIREKHPEIGSLTPHVLRHTWATGALRAMVDIKQVQEALGHASLATTAIYLHTDAESMANAMNKAEDWR
jgi:integrase